MAGEPSDSDFNLSLRRFLKRVGVTSQQEIEAALRAAGPDAGPVAIKVVLTAPSIGLQHVVEGEIAADGGGEP